MNNRQLEALRDLVRQDPTLIWYSKSYDTLDAEAVTEAVLNYGSWKQFLQLKKIMGLKPLAEQFDIITAKERCNLLPIYRHYFKQYFSHHAH